jgi:hypothetical protein
MSSPASVARIGVAIVFPKPLGYEGQHDYVSAPIAPIAVDDDDEYDDAQS